MKSSKLFDTLLSLTPEEQREFSKFLDSPYHNQREDIRGLYAEFLEHEATERNWEDEAVGKKILGSDHYFPTKFTHVKNYLFSCLKDFLIAQKLKTDGLLQNDLLLQELSDRNIPQVLEKELVLADTREGKMPLRNEYFELMQFRRMGLRYNMTEARSEKGIAHLNQVFHHLDKFYVLNRLKWLFSQANHIRLVNVGDPEKTWQEYLLVVGLMNAMEISEEPLIKIYQNCFLLAFGKGDDELFHELKAHLQENENALFRDDLKSIYMMLVNFCIRQANAGAEKYVSHLFEIYKRMLANGTMLEKGVLSPYSYKNIISTAIKLGEIEWGGSFLDEYATLLPEHSAKTFRNYNQARLMLHQGEFQAVVRLLSGFYISDAFTLLDARVTLIKALFELEDFSALEYQISNFRKLLARRSIIAYHRKYYLNFSKHLLRLLKLPLGEGKAKKEFVKKVMEATDLVERDWLLEKATEW